MSTETILFIILVVLLVGAIPSWNYSKGWGYGPSGALTLLLVVFLVWALAGNRPLFRSDVGSSVNHVGKDIKAAGRDAADAVRDAVN